MTPQSPEGLGAFAVIGALSLGAAVAGSPGVLGATPVWGTVATTKTTLPFHRGKPAGPQRAEHHAGGTTGVSPSPSG